MAADPESTSWLAALATALGVGSGGGLWRLLAKQSQYDEKHRVVESRLNNHATRIDETHTKLTTLTERTAALGEKTEEVRTDVKAIRSLIENYQQRRER